MYDPRPHHRVVGQVVYDVAGVNTYHDLDGAAVEAFWKAGPIDGKPATMRWVWLSLDVASALQQPAGAELLQRNMPCSTSKAGHDAVRCGRKVRRELQWCLLCLGSRRAAGHDAVRQEHHGKKHCLEGRFPHTRNVHSKASPIAWGQGVLVYRQRMYGGKGTWLSECVECVRKHTQRWLRNLDNLDVQYRSAQTWKFGIRKDNP